MQPEHHYHPPITAGELACWHQWNSVLTPIDGYRRMLERDIAFHKRELEGDDQLTAADRYLHGVCKEESELALAMYLG